MNWKRRPSKAKPVIDRISASFLRRRKATRLQKRRYAKKTSQAYTVPPSSFSLIGQVFLIFKKHWRPLGGIVLVYLVLNVIFASGFSNIGNAFENIKLSLQSGAKWQFSEALNGFGSLVGGAGLTTSETASVLQVVLFILASLVIIWALRHLLAGQMISIKQAYYQSMTPLVPFLIIMFVIFIQLLPLTVGSLIVAWIASAIFTVGSTADIITGIAIFCFGVWSIYMLSSSIFALYIVTLPEMEPRKALRSAKNLVRFRRWGVIRRLIFLPIFILLLMGLIIVPLILYFEAAVVATFFIMSMLVILFAHTYLYSLYRGLLE